MLFMNEDGTIRDDLCYDQDGQEIERCAEWFDSHMPDSCTAYALTSLSEALKNGLQWEESDQFNTEEPNEDDEQDHINRSVVKFVEAFRQEFGRAPYEFTHSQYKLTTRSR